MTKVKNATRKGTEHPEPAVSSEEKPVQHSHATAKKSVVIKHHHAKPYRKRHIAGFMLFLLSGSLLIGLTAGYNSKVRDGISSAKEFVVETINPQSAVNETISSDFGFSITYDSKKFFATGLDAKSGELYIGRELHVVRSYDTLRVAPTFTDTEKASTNLTIRFYSDKQLANPNDIAAVEAMALKDITAQANLQAKKTGTSNVVYGGKQFQKTEWEFASDNKVLAGFTPSFTTYSGVHEGKAFVMEVLGSIDSKSSTQYEEVLQSLYFGAPTATMQSSMLPMISDKTAANRNLLETALFGKLAYAATTEATDAQKISAIYGPAVVKVYNIFCHDIYIDGKSLLPNLCIGGTGSGFFVTEDGHIASNGHVTSSDPKDNVLEAVYNDLRLGNTKALDLLVSLAGITEADLPANGTPKERLDVVFDLLYKMDSSRFTTRNNVTNLLVALGKEQPDLKELIDDTKKRIQYPEQETVKRAKKIAENYRTIDGIVKWYSSDVSLIKIEGGNYPVTKLGSIDSLQQGANLNILGFPGNASDNGLVESKDNAVTLTSGKVSAIKNAQGSDKKLIETDTTIGHGNSGGPAFNDLGEVMGISTYTATKVGDGTYNYIRDIKDLQDLAKTASVTITGTSKTQDEWKKGQEYFLNSRFSKALVSFKKVKELYPNHPKAVEYIAKAEENIKLGKDVKDFPVVMAIVGGVILLAAAATFIVFMKRHKHAHNVYKAHVGAGMMQPIPQGSAPQTVMYDPAHIAAQRNVVDMHAYLQQAPQLQAPMQPQQMSAPVMPAQQQTVQQPYVQAPQAVVVQPPSNPAAAPTQQQLPPQQPQQPPRV